MTLSLTASGTRRLGVDGGLNTVTTGKGNTFAELLSESSLNRNDELYSAFGHDKSLEIKPYFGLPGGNCPLLFYAGDGVSDLSAASQTHVLFAKEGLGEFSW